MPARREGWTNADQRHWRKLRTFVLERDDHTCACGRRTRTVARVDFDGPEFEPSNLQAECRRCLGRRSVKRATHKPRPYPTAETIARPNAQRSTRQAWLIRELGGDPDGLTRAQATSAIQQLIAEGRNQLATELAERRAS